MAQGTPSPDAAPYRCELHDEDHAGKPEVESQCLTCGRQLRACATLPFRDGKPDLFVLHTVHQRVCPGEMPQPEPLERYVAGPVDTSSIPIKDGRRKP